MTKDLRAYLTVVIIIGAILGIGIILGSCMQERISEINVLSGTAQYRLEEQSDGTIDWIKTTPYAIDCTPTEY